MGATSAGTSVGPIGRAVTGLAFAPDGTLYATTARRDGALDLLTIDPLTGASTLVGPTIDGAGPTSCTDLTFLDARLLGWGLPGALTGQRAVEVDPATGFVTSLGGGLLPGGGNALAADASGLLWVIATLDPVRQIYSVDPADGTVTPTAAVSPDGGVINSMSWLEGVLYVVDSSNAVGQVPGAPNDLATLDPVSGILTTIGPLPVGVDAIAGPQP
jgi:hypothetical protein